MKFLRDSLEETRKRMGVQRDAVECDYALSWILAGVRRIPSLKDTLVFRGGHSGNAVSAIAAFRRT